MEYVLMDIFTKVFDLANEKYRSLTELARAMEISVSHVYRVKQGTRCKFDELFYFTVRLKPNGNTRKDEDGS